MFFDRKELYGKGCVVCYIIENLMRRNKLRLQSLKNAKASSMAVCHAWPQLKGV